MTTIKGLIIGISCLGIGFGGSGLIFNNGHNLETISYHDYKYTIGETSAKYTTKNQWRFLYLLAGKVFNYLSKDSKAKKQSGIGASGKANVIEWLKDKFSLTGDWEDKWESFREVCTEGLRSEDSINWSIPLKIMEVRLCFMGEKKFSETEMKDIPSHIILQLIESESKGNLNRWSNYHILGRLNDDNKQLNNPYLFVNFFRYKNWNKTNYDLWEDFKKSDQGSSVADNNEIDYDKFKSKWEEWYETAHSYEETQKGNDTNESNQTTIKKIKEALEPEILDEDNDYL